ncbi:type I polyketide synthase [Pseudoalteromonas rubra]|uniref:type I polyketide synthase n=1 Tax=Pseudoalteromonas rubra TaxID=43658 RepID=UPI000F7AC62C|nr:type I polyketide synthase [Pseudoalteromonas rubra]
MLNHPCFSKLAGQEAPAHLVELLQWRSDKFASQPAYHFVSGPGKPVQSLTYGELFTAAQQLAVKLQRQGACNERVILLSEPGLDYIISFWGCVLAGAIAVPAFPPVIARLEQTLPRIEAIICDCQPKYALASDKLLSKRSKITSKSEVFATLSWLSVREPAQPKQAQTDWQPVAPAPHATAFLQYTSGSTSTPKGVEVSHANLIHNSQAIFQALDGDNTFVSWLPPYHDMGLIGNIIQVVYGGGWGYFMAPNTFLRYPQLWLELISTHRARVSVAPNFGYQHCVNKLTDEQVNALDLSCWQHALSGAEPVRFATIQAFQKRFAPAGFSEATFQPCYGLAEATLIVSGGKPKHSARKLNLDSQALQAGQVLTAQHPLNAIESVACGKAALDTEIAIVNPDSCERVSGQRVGEIWVNAPGVAKGYWQKPDISQATFHAHIRNEADKPYLRTGDLGFIDEHGELHITGRKKDLIVLRGKNYFPNDIENIAQQSYEGAIGKAIAFSITMAGQEELVVLLEANTTNEDALIDLVARARQRLAEPPLALTPYAVLAVKSGAIPQTSSGKLQRFQAKESFLTFAMPCLFASVVAHDLETTVAQDSSDKLPKDLLLSQLDALRAEPVEVAASPTFADLALQFDVVCQLDNMISTRFATQSHLCALLQNPTLSHWLALLETADTSSSSPHQSITKTQIRTQLIHQLAQLTGLPASHINLNLSFSELGLDSGNSVKLAKALGETFGLTLSDTFVWEAPTVEQAIELLSQQLSGPTPVAAATQTSHSQSDNGAIAIIGMACRFPQANDLSEFWQLLCSQRDAITQVSPDRWPDMSMVKTKSGYSVPLLGGFLDQVDGFEPQIFGISHREASKMDPQHRLLLENSWQALEHAGIAPKSIAGSKTGVFVSSGPQEYWQLQSQNLAELDIHSCTGGSQAVAANRISYCLNLTGPSLTIDTACSGSLVAVHQACESLRRGESTMALAGGVNLMLKPDLTVAFTEAQMLSPRGRCATFDQHADGYVRGEGCGIVVLKRLTDALRDGDPILAQIAGSAVGHDGKSNGLTAPNPQAQHQVIEQALTNSGLCASQVGLIEAHGTGTPLGDPIEAKVLANIYNSRQTPTRWLSSVKANIGHLESAAGIAGLIKAVMCVQHGKVPGQLHCATPTERIDWEHAELTIPSHTQAWSEAHNNPRTAAVSSFGFGGTIAHLLVTQAPDDHRECTAPETPQLLQLSARTPASVSAQANAIRHFIDQNPDITLPDICHTLSGARDTFEHRFSTVVDSMQALSQALSDLEQSVHSVTQPVTSDSNKVVFCFSGQGSQFTAMGKTLLNQPVFKKTFAQCNRLFAQHAQCELSLVELLHEDTDPTLLRNTAIQQPLIFALQASLDSLWKAQGVAPDLVLGHSLGEIAAMYSAQSLSLSDAMQLAIKRGHLMAQAPTEGAMLACLGEESALTKLTHTLNEHLWLAADNAPGNRVFAGPRAQLEALKQSLPMTVEGSWLPVSGAFHTPMMADAAAQLQQFAEQFEFAKPAIPVISSVTSEVLTQRPDGAYLARQMREPVQFKRAVERALAHQGKLFIELGPGRTLLNFALKTAQINSQSIHGFPSIVKRQDAYSAQLVSLGKLWQLGYPVTTTPHSHSTGKRINMPSYQFDRDSYWNQPETAEPVAQTRPATPPAGQESSLMQAALSLFQSQSAVLQSLAGQPQSTTHAMTATQVQAQAASSQNTAITQPAPAAQVSRESSHATLVSLLASIAGCAPSDIHDNDKLHSQLGLDSLMVKQLTKQLKQTWPELSQFKAEQLEQDPSVAELVAIVDAQLNPHPTQVTASLPNAAMSWQAQAPAQAEATEESHTVVPETDFEQSEEYQTHIARLNMINAIGENPYGRIHQGLNSGRATLNDVDVLNFASFNYSGLSNHPEVIAATQAAVAHYGTSPSATPLLFGETPLHHELESEIADYLGCEASVVFASGHSTSVAVIGHIMDKQDLVIHDQWIHDCAVRGAMLSGAQRRSFGHDDWAELDKILSKIRKYYRRVLIVIEGVYSQDGDIGNLPEFIRIKKQHNCMLMIDEAHSIGVLGKTGAGAGEYYDVVRSDVDIWMGTLSKGLGSCGGYIAASKNFIQFLKYTTPLLIFSTGITPANAAAALEAIRVLRREPERLEKLKSNAAWFLARAQELGFDCGPTTHSPIIPIIVGEWEVAMLLSARLREKHINVMPIGYPAVEKHRCRLRFFMNVEHTREELEFALQSLLSEMTQLKTEQLPETESV